MKTVVATGVFEIIHPGHLLFLAEAKKLGDKLVVIIARDANVAKRKRRTHILEQQRRDVVAALKMVDEAVLGARGDTLTPLKRIQPDIVALGPDQEFDDIKLQTDIKDAGLSAKVVRISRYWRHPLYGTRKIIKKIQQR